MSSVLEAPRPADEEERLAALRALEVLDTPREERFERITRTASRLFRVPFALVSLVDAERQWFKSCHGLGLEETPRALSFCAHAILSDEPLVIGNTLADPRFAGHPMVTGEPGIRFYAGQPLRSGGRALGTLCILDTRPRELEPEDLSALADLAAWAESELGSVELGRALAERDASESRVRAVMQSALDGIVLFDEEGTIESANRAAEELFGHAPGTLAGRRADVLLADLSWEDVAPALRHGVAGAGDGIALGRRGEVAGLRADGSRLPLELVVGDTRVGERRMLVAIGRDVTARRRADEARRESERRFRAIFDSAAIGIALTDDEGLLAEANHALRRMLGYDAITLWGRRLGEIIDPADAAEGERLHRELLAGHREGYRMETRCLRSDGQPVPVAVTASLVRDAEGDPQYALAMVEDITERRRAQAAFERISRQTERILESTAEGILGIDREGRTTFVNEAAAAAIGYRPEELVGRRPHEILHHSYADGTPYPWEACATRLSLVDGTTHRVTDEVFWRKDGTCFPVEYVSSPIVEHGEITGAVETFRDVTERRALERMKDEFLSVAGHELRTPLTSIRGSLGLLAGGVVDAASGEGRQMLEMAVASADRLVRLVNDLLDIERMESGRLTGERRIVPAAELVQAAQGVTEPLAREAGVEIIAGEAPPLAVEVDADRAVQTLTNLIGNAVKFSPAGARVWVSVVPEESAALFRVEDEGRGIPEDQLEAIFERLRQVDASDARRGGGTGLGLAIASAIVTEHGGRIWAERREPEGSRLSFTLPLAGPGARP